MINPKELRIGNIVQDSEGNIGVISLITKMSVDVIHDEGYNNLNIESDELQPVPITEEWLLMLGFSSHPCICITHDVEYVHPMEEDDESIQYSANIYYENYGLIWVEFTNEHGQYATYNSDHIKHVHQLQNLFFALTGKELTIKQ